MERSAVYKCSLCGNITEVVHVGGGILSCCGQPMTLFAPNTTEAAIEKHIPVLELTNQGVKAVVGSVAHPMTEAHYIEWIELIADGQIYRHFLKATDQPEAFFPIQAKKMAAQAYCNLHGLWRD